MCLTINEENFESSKDAEFCYVHNFDVCFRCGRLFLLRHDDDQNICEDCIVEEFLGQ